MHRYVLEFFATMLKTLILISGNYINRLLTYDNTAILYRALWSALELCKITAPASSQTVRNVLKAVTKKKKPLLSIQHRQRRLAFALAHQHWTVEDWKCVIWSDETKINRIGSDRKVYV
jgi:hypothetical protein